MRLIKVERNKHRNRLWIHARIVATSANELFCKMHANETETVRRFHINAAGKRLSLFCIWQETMIRSRSENRYFEMLVIFVVAFYLGKLLRSFILLIWPLLLDKLSRWERYTVMWIEIHLFQSTRPCVLSISLTYFESHDT